MNRKIKKVILIPVLIGLVVPSLYISKIGVTSASDLGGSWAQFTAWMSKEFGVDLIARAFARRLLRTYLAKMVAQINQSGRTGRQPSFAINWRNFLTEAQYRGEDIFGKILYNTELCPYFGGQIRGSFRAKPGIVSQNPRVNNLDPFSQRAKCTMPQGWMPQNLDDNFVQGGGWLALMRLAEPQNNTYGSLLMASGELAAQRALEASTDYGEITSGGGYTGTRAKCQGSGPSGICRDTPLAPGDQGPTRKTCTNNQSKICDTNADCVVLNSAARCTFLGEVLTPGKLLGDAASNYVDKNVGWLITSDELSEVILSMIGGIINRMTNFRTHTKSGNPENDGTPVDDTEGPSVNNAFKACIKNYCNGLVSNEYTDCYLRCLNESPPGSSGGVPPSPPPAPGVVCTDPGNTSPRYFNDLVSAVNAVIAINPGGIADQPNTAANSLTFLNIVVNQLISAGLQATTNVLDEASNPNPGDLIGVWRTGDFVLDRYDVVIRDTELSAMPLRIAVQPDSTPPVPNDSVSFSGQVPLAGCISGASNLPPSTPAITSCSDGTTTPTNTNVCLTAQWFRQGQAGSADPSSICSSSHCVITNYNIWDNSNYAEIFQNSTVIHRLNRQFISDYQNGTRVTDCSPSGDTAYALNTDTTQVPPLVLPIPLAGAGFCLGGLPNPIPGQIFECNDGLDNDGDLLIDRVGGPNGEPRDPGCVTWDDPSE